MHFPRLPSLFVLTTSFLITPTFAQLIRTLDELTGPSCSSSCLETLLDEYPRSMGCSSTFDWACLCENHFNLANEVNAGSTARAKALTKFSVCAVTECGAAMAMDAAAALLPFDLKCASVGTSGSKTDTTTSRTSSATSASSTPSASSSPNSSPNSNPSSSPVTEDQEDGPAEAPKKSLEEVLKDLETATVRANEKLDQSSSTRAVSGKVAPWIGVAVAVALWSL
ncbi:hypothetical protein BJ508DRAFT_418915 [Ascobolus immersus RN42]|uniref:Extracellular membrane protein CFEM domain-containing protein n=1 Tax=Ascobolus immersus RN42 TaxID=1160509 RepID=A0A3N4HMJ7_ASCIM|nr:hypothetical protein BJ508DRAFT_418915 [Ascobolus immersus RN42]